MLVVVVFVLYSVTVALSTADDCGSGPKSWQLFPPAWECETTPGYG